MEKMELIDGFPFSVLNRENLNIAVMIASVTKERFSDSPPSPRALTQEGAFSVYL
jgi:hypothetical protein